MSDTASNGAPWLAAATDFLIYLATMFPGLAGIGDSPKLQFVGSVLGTAHAPGYPLYVCLSWLFAQLPIGSLAYRANLMSAVFGAAAVGLLAALLRMLGVRPVAALVIGVAAGLGRVFWSQAIIAEVYTLNAAIFLAMVCALASWRQHRRDRDLLLATVAFALGLAHHPTMWLTAPAVGLFVLATEPRVLVRPGLLVSVGAILAAGASMYGFIWLRTVQGAPLLEAQARSAAEILGQMRGDQFAGELFEFGATHVMNVRVPLIAGWIGGELLIPGMVLATIGFAGLLRNSWRMAVLLLVVGLSVSALALQHRALDIEVFLILPMLVMWIWAGVGLELTLRAVAALAEQSGWRALTAVAGILTLAFPLWLGAINFGFNNKRNHRHEMDYFDALFRELPDKAVFVEEGYVIDSMVRYKIIGERGERDTNAGVIPPDPAIVRRFADAGFRIYAFSSGREMLERQGMRLELFRFEAPEPRPESGGYTHASFVRGVFMVVPIR